MVCALGVVVEKATPCGGVWLAAIGGKERVYGDGMEVRYAYSTLLAFRTESERRQCHPPCPSSQLRPVVGEGGGGGGGYHGGGSMIDGNKSGILSHGRIS